MKNAKKLLALALAAMMSVTALAGCGNKTASDNGASNSSTDDTLIIGCTGPLTGDVSSYGISVKNGAELAIAEINEKGGVDGLKLSLNMKDDKADATEAGTAYNQLIDEGMKISLGSVTSGACESFASKSVEDNLFFITPSASNADIIAKRDNGFRICFGDPDQGILAADELVNTRKYTKIGCIYDTSDPYSSGIYEAFKGEMDKLGVTFITKTFDAENNKDFSTQVEAMKDCEVIFTPFYYTEAGLVARACSAKGISAIIFGADGLDGVADQIDSTVKNEISYITPFDVKSKDEKVASFVSAYTAKYNTVPDQFAADGYDAVYVIAEILKTGKVDVSKNVSEICESAKAAITDPSFKFKGVTGEITWSKDGAPTKSLNIVTVEK